MGSRRREGLSFQQGVGANPWAEPWMGQKSLGSHPLHRCLSSPNPWASIRAEGTGRNLQHLALLPCLSLHS